MEAQGLEGACPEADELLCKLRDNRRRFQRRMQQLIAKYERPFENDPLVQMSTLTYETPQGLRIWGGKLIKEIDKGQIQDPPGKPVDRTDDPRPLQDPASSDADAASGQGYPPARALKPAVPRSPLKDDLRRKYLTQVDILLQDAGGFEGTEKGVRKDAPRTSAPSVISPAVPAPGFSGGDSTESLSSPAQPASSLGAWGPLHPCPPDVAAAPRNDSLLSSQSFTADDICDVTVSDLYAGMLHSMSRLLSSKPSCIISTKTSIVQNWSSRRRHPRRGRARMNETYCRGTRHSRKSAMERSTPRPEPRRARGTLRDCENLLHTAHHKTVLKSEKAFLEENKPQLHKSDPGWKELQVTPQKRSSLTYLDFSAGHLDWENRLKTLKWLISPVKIGSRSRMLQGCAENRYREIESRFDRLHLKCCPSPGEQALPAGHSEPWAVALYGGGRVHPGGSQGLETHRLRLPLRRAAAKSLSKTFEHLDKRSVEMSRRPPKRDSSSPLSKPHPPQSPGHSPQPSDLLQGQDARTTRKAVSPGQAISVPRIETLSCGKSRYDEIKEKFDQLHQKYFQMSPQQAKVSSHVGAPAGKAGAGVQCQTGDSFGKFNLDPRLQGFQGLLRSPWGLAAVEAAGSARRDPPVAAKRRRLSDPQVCGLQSRGAGQPLPALPWKEQHIPQDERKK